MWLCKIGDNLTFPKEEMMIWLSPASGTAECSIYFEIRDINLQCCGDVTSGVVRGLLGDGSRELWGEVFLGAAEPAQILPVWTETGEGESFSAAVAESLLLQQMLAEVKTLIPGIGNIGNYNPSPVWQKTDPVECCPDHNLAA